MAPNYRTAELRGLNEAEDFRIRALGFEVQIQGMVAHQEVLRLFEVWLLALEQRRVAQHLEDVSVLLEPKELREVASSPMPQSEVFPGGANRVRFWSV